VKRIANFFLIAIAGILALVIVVPLVVPIPPLEHVMPPEKLADPDSRFIELNNLQVHYKISGEGKPAFLLLHGFAASEFSWRAVRQPLAKFGTAIAYDRPAFGLTARPTEWSGANPYGMDANVALAIQMLDAFKIEKAILVGNSAGGTIATLTALKNPERVQALVLVDPAIYPGNTRMPDWVSFLLNTPQAKRVGPFFVRNIRDWGIEFGKSAWHDPTKITPEIWAGYTKPLQAENWDRSLWEYTLTSRPNDLASQLGEIQVPVLVITGDDDRIVPTERSVRLARELPNAKLVVIPNCGHVPHEECPGEFMNAVREFIAGLK
jgi:pimeloyl-ACP methyl ester carboxylesterase